MAPSYCFQVLVISFTVYIKIKSPLHLINVLQMKGWQCRDFIKRLFAQPSRWHNWFGDLACDGHQSFDFASAR